MRNGQPESRDDEGAEDTPGEYERFLLPEGHTLGEDGTISGPDFVAQVLNGHGAYASVQSRHRH